MVRRRNRALILVTVTALMLACVPTLPTLGTGSAPVPTFDVNAPLTAIVQTANAAASLTATNLPPTPTQTASPSPTPTDTPTATPTFLYLIFIPPTNTVPPTLMPVGASGKTYECQIFSVEPITASPSASFTARWVVANVGKEGWDKNNADYRYVAGYRMHIQSIFDFESTIMPGVTAEFKVPMQAPPSAGTYTTSWRITIGKNQFCNMDLVLTVQ
ncbi:MAG TPA: NBR1-Ig-like domain-containing protein [Anaerolineales bacterium]|nr:NBR1-Ig-like domain-containing protein [Anaerolineales bacterium]HNO31776.1 NBR1-Ig-like domain-containing protein [Anaerolineales bacterium]